MEIPIIERYYNQALKWAQSFQDGKTSRAEYIAYTKRLAANLTKDGITQEEFINYEKTVKKSL